MRNPSLASWSIAALCGLALLHSRPTLAADVNGYIAEYECRAGGARCNVDMTPPACDVTIRPTDDWASVIGNNPGARTFCVQCGDHRKFHDYRDLVTLDASTSGSAGARRWLRYWCPADSGAHPALQPPDQRAYIPRIFFNGADYWVLDRLTIDFDGRDINTGIQFALDSGSNNNILNRLLLEDASAHFVQMNKGNADNTLQNSVVRSPVPTTQYESQCVEAGSGPRFHAVNNEIYNCQKGISIGNGHIDHPGLVIENNDLYATPQVYTDCHGTFTPEGKCGLTEDMISLKAGGTAADPVLVIHNRLWGGRTGDPNVSLTLNGDGDAMGLGISGLRDSPDTQGYPGGDWVLFRHNIVWDSGVGLSSVYPSAENLSVVANLFWDMAESQREPSVPSTFNTYGGINQSEFYFNTIVAGDGWLKAFGDTFNDDFRCNLIVGAGPNEGDLSSGTQIANNAFFGTTPFTTESPSSDVTGASVADAQQTAFCFYRKLITGAERFCIPNAAPTAASPHRNACNAAIGSRPGIGINNAQAPWIDLLGRPRDSTPDMGAIEFAADAGSGSVTYVSDLPYTVAANGYGPVEKDMSNGEDGANDGRVLALNGATYAKGLGVHAVSEVRVPLNGNYTRFVSDIGIDDEMDGTPGTAQFEVWADGVRLYQSPDMNAASATITVNVDISGKQELVLKVLEGSVGCCDHADWAGARLLTNVTYVSDLPYVGVSNGYGPVEKDRSNGEDGAGDGRVMTLNGIAYAKGLGVHAVSEVRVSLNGNYTRFISDIGIDDEMDGTAGTAQFEVWADGVRLYQSPDMNAASPTLTVNLDVTGKQELRLIVTEGSVGCCDHADWAGARLVSNTTYVSDLPYTVITNGYGPVEKDRSNGEDAAGDGRVIMLNGAAYPKGLGAHAVSEIRVPLSGNYSRFISDIGIDDEMDGTVGTAQFEVWADGVRLYQSPDMNAASQTITVNLDVTGKQELRLIVTEGSVGCCDHADWAGARLQQ